MNLGSNVANLSHFIKIFSTIQPPSQKHKRFEKNAHWKYFYMYNIGTNENPEGWWYMAKWPCKSLWKDLNKV